MSRWALCVDLEQFAVNEGVLPPNVSQLRDLNPSSEGSLHSQVVNHESHHVQPHHLCPAISHALSHERHQAVMRRRRRSRRGGWRRGCREASVCGIRKIPNEEVWQDAHAPYFVDARERKALAVYLLNAQELLDALVSKCHRLADLPQPIELPIEGGK